MRRAYCSPRLPHPQPSLSSRSSHHFFTLTLQLQTLLSLPIRTISTPHIHNLLRKLQLNHIRHRRVSEQIAIMRRPLNRVRMQCVPIFPRLAPCIVARNVARDCAGAGLGGGGEGPEEVAGGDGGES